MLQRRFCAVCRQPFLPKDEGDWLCTPKCVEVVQHLRTQRAQEAAKIPEPSPIDFGPSEAEKARAALQSKRFNEPETTLEEDDSIEMSLLSASQHIIQAAMVLLGTADGLALASLARAYLDRVVESHGPDSDIRLGDDLPQRDSGVVGGPPEA